MDVFHFPQSPTHSFTNSECIEYCINQECPSFNPCSSPCQGWRERERARSEICWGWWRSAPPSPWAGWQAASLDRVRSGCSAGERAALRRAWRGVGRGAGGREGEVGEFVRVEEGDLGRVHPLRAAAQTRAEEPRLAFSDLPVSSVENREPWFFLSRAPARTVGVVPPHSFEWAAAQRL